MNQDLSTWARAAEAGLMGQPPVRVTPSPTRPAMTPGEVRLSARVVEEGAVRQLAAWAAAAEAGMTLAPARSMSARPLASAYVKRPDRAAVATTGPDGRVEWRAIGGEAA